MRKLRTLTALFLVVAAIISTVSCAEAEKPDIEAPAYTVQNFTVLDENLSEVSLEDFIGEPIVINFWATWCYYCKIEMPDFNEAYHDYPGVRFMMINYTDGKNETVEKAKAYVSGEGFDFPIYFDTTLEASEKYNVEAFPMTFFISREGDLVKTQRGAMSGERLREYIALIAE